MGILTSLITNLGNELVDMGIDQLDAFITNEIKEGRTENALDKLDEWENQVIQNYNIANRVGAGTYNLPGMDLAGGQGGGVLPVNYPGQEQDLMQYFSQVPQLPSEVFNAPEISNVVSSRYADVIANNPYNIQRQMQAEAQKARTGLVKEMVGESYKQNQMGFQEGLGAFDRPTAYDLPREERNRRIGDTQYSRTTGQYEAAEPFKENAYNRSVQLRQTPTYAQLNKGTGPEGGPVSSVTTTDLNKFENILGQKSIYAYTDKLSNKKILNQRGNDVLNRAADILSMQKKKNPLSAIKQAMDSEKAVFNALPVERRMEIMGRPPLKINQQLIPQPDRLPKAEKERRQREAVMPMPEGAVGYLRSISPTQGTAPTALQNLPKAQPTQAPTPTPLPRAIDNLPRPQPTQPPQPSAQTQGQGLTQAQINQIDAQVRNADPITREQWLQKLKDRGIDPSQIPSLR